MKPAYLVLLPGLWGCTPPASEVTGLDTQPAAEADTDTDTDADTDSDTDADDTADTDTPDDTGDTGDPLVSVRVQPAVVLFIGDGMGYEHVRGGGLYVNGAEGSLVMETAPHQASLITASFTGYTDSAASATAYATGVKTWNGVLGMDHEVEPVTNVLEQAKLLGMATGVVTTDELGGATPSAFVVHQSSRGAKVDIADDWMGNLPDLAMGGGSLLFAPLFQEAAIDVVLDKAALAETDPLGLPLYGLFANVTFPFVADGYEETQPSLAEMVSTALDRLEGDPEGFVLVVEGARIDHASHFNNKNNVYPETAAFDEAIAVAVDRLGTWEGRDTAIFVTADHECGGLQVGASEGAGTIPETSWRWGDHTNADVPLFAWGDVASVIDGQRLDSTVVNSLLQGALFSGEVVLPEGVSLPDGELSDLGDPVVTQTWDTDFGAGYTQLDGLRLTATGSGLKVGIDGVFNDGGDAVLVWVDIDYGESTGVGADLLLTDPEGNLDSLLVSLSFDGELAGLGFDAAVGQIDGTYGRMGDLDEFVGLRTFSLPDGAADNLSWEQAILNFDSGNLAAGSAASDAAATGTTENGLEIWLPWTSLYGDGGLPADGAKLAIFAHALNSDGTTISNQALPPFASETAPATDAIAVAQVVVLEVDGAGSPLGEAALAP